MVNTLNIEHEAAKLRDAALGVGSMQRTPVIQIAQNLGYQVEKFTPVSKTASISGAVNHQTKTIFVNENENPARKRFTIAHEIGHVVLHGDEPAGFVDYRHQLDYSTQDRPKEREANMFAVHLLMPKPVFEAAWQCCGGNARSVADMLQVSRQAVGIRASELGLTP